MPIKHVVSAIFLRDGKIFAAERGHGSYIHFWEFPGGKVETGESAEEALRREIQEELDIPLIILQHFKTVDFDYPDFHLHMDCFLCRLLGREPVLKEHLAARWLSPEELWSVNWLPADHDVIDALEQMLNG